MAEAEQLAEHGVMELNLVSQDTIAYGRDYNDVSPISGVLLGGGAHAVSVGVDVVNLDTAPTVH